MSLPDEILDSDLATLRARLQHRLDRKTKPMGLRWNSLNSWSSPAITVWRREVSLRIPRT